MSNAICVRADLSQDRLYNTGSGVIPDPADAAKAQARISAIPLRTASRRIPHIMHLCYRGRSSEVMADGAHMVTLHCSRTERGMRDRPHATVKSGASIKMQLSARFAQCPVRPILNSAFHAGISAARRRTGYCANRRRSGNASLQTEDEQKSLVDRAEPGDVEASGRRAESLRIDHGRLFNEHSRFLSLENDRRTKGCCAGARRGGRDQNGAQIEKLVRLDDDRVSRTTLLVAAGAPRRREPKDLAPDHG